MRKVAFAVPVLLGAVVQPGVAEAQPDQADPLPGGQDPAVRFLMEKYGLSEAEATSRMDRMRQLEALVEDLGEDYGPVWAGAWIDNAAGGRATIAVTTDKAVAQVESRVADISDVAVVRVNVPASELSERLERLAGNLSSIAKAHAVPAGELFAGAVDIQSNRVVIEVADAPTTADPIAFAEARAAVHARAESMAEAAARAESVAEAAVRTTPVVVRAVPRLVEADTECTTDWCHPLHGGTTVNSSTGGLCTLGFTFKDSSAATYISTAGHCSGSPWSHNGIRIGPTRGSVNAGRADAKTILVEDPGMWKPNNEIRRGGNQIFKITAQVSNPSSSLEGTVLCTVGAGRQNRGLNTEQCGELSDFDTTWQDRPGFGRMNDVATCDGDSGGPVFNGATNRAYGTINGFSDDDPGDCEGDNDLKFTWVSNIESALGRQILLEHINY